MERWTQLLQLKFWIFLEAIMNNFTNSSVKAFETKGGKVFISADDQQREIDRYHINCLTQILYGEKPSSGLYVRSTAKVIYGREKLRKKEKPALYCNMTWDNIACWPDTEPGSIAVQPCPNYIHGFLVGNFATKKCMSDGNWFFHPTLNRTWTNYSECFDLATEKLTPGVSRLIEVHMSYIRLMYNVGYSVSLISLTAAVFVMTYFKRLHCPRNTVHVNLFVSFILRATLSILKETLLVQGLGLRKDVEITPYDDTILFIEEGTHWECKLLFTIFYYVLSASYMWIFVEGIHLHTLIMVSVFSERSSIKYYICLGWGSPFLFIIPWVVVRITKENLLCWNTNPTHEYFWIINGPVVLSIAINFLLFLNILRALLTKIKTPSSRSKKYKYRRLAKATMVLIPLFGVHYIVSMGIPSEVDPKTEVIKLYYEMFFNSFQGLFVAILFCFLNDEVQMEILKRLCRKGPYYHYRRYYRTSFGHSSSKCTCHCHKHLIDGNNSRSRHSHSDNDEPVRRYSEGANSNLNTDRRFTKTCVCRWRIDSNGHISRYVKRTINQNCSQHEIHRADSCL